MVEREADPVVTHHWTRRAGFFTGLLYSVPFLQARVDFEDRVGYGPLIVCVFEYPRTQYVLGPLPHPSWDDVGEECDIRLSMSEEEGCE